MSRRHLSFRACECVCRIRPLTGARSCPFDSLLAPAACNPSPHDGTGCFRVLCPADASRMPLSPSWLAYFSSALPLPVHLPSMHPATCRRCILPPAAPERVSGHGVALRCHQPGRLRRWLAGCAGVACVGAAVAVGSHVPAVLGLLLPAGNGACQVVCRPCCRRVRRVRRSVRLEPRNLGRRHCVVGGVVVGHRRRRRPGLCAAGVGAAAQRALCCHGAGPNPRSVVNGCGAFGGLGHRRRTAAAREPAPQASTFVGRQRARLGIGWRRRRRHGWADGPRVPGWRADQRHRGEVGRGSPARSRCWTLEPDPLVCPVQRGRRPPRRHVPRSIRLGCETAARARSGAGQCRVSAAPRMVRVRWQMRTSATRSLAHATSPVPGGCVAACAVHCRRCGDPPTVLQCRSMSGYHSPWPAGAHLHVADLPGTGREGDGLFDYFLNESGTCTPPGPVRGRIERLADCECLRFSRRDAPRVHVRMTRILGALVPSVPWCRAGRSSTIARW